MPPVRVRTRAGAAAIAAAIACGCLAATACIDRRLVNTACRWPASDRPVVLSLSRPADHRHLIDDAQLAEELAIRFADAEYARRTGYEGHGGLLEHGAYRAGCMARLSAAITDRHGVTDDEIQQARAERNPWFDLTAALTFLPIYLGSAYVLAKGLMRRVASHDRRAQLIVTTTAALVVSLSGVQVFQLWLSVWEAARVGNGHMSTFRLANGTRWNQMHFAWQIMGGAAAFGAVTIWGATRRDWLRANVTRVPPGVILR